MYHETVQTSVVDDEALPWVPFAPYSNEVQLKYFKLDPIRGEMIVLMKVPAGIELPCHHHSGTVIVHAIKGCRKYRGRDWIAGPGSVVFETAASSYTPEAASREGHVVALNFLVGDLVFLDGGGLAIENRKRGLERYLMFCEQAGTTPRDLTALG